MQDRLLDAAEAVSSKESENTLVLQPIPAPIGITMTNAIIKSIVSRSTTKKYDPLPSP